MESMHFKIALLGNGGVGKTALVKCMLGAQFNELEPMTIAVTHETIQNIYRGYELIFQVWDLGGQERFQSLHTDFLNGSSAIIICYDLSSPPSIQAIPKWVELANSAVKNPLLYLVGCKSDLARDENYLDHFLCGIVNPVLFDGHIKCSAKLNKNIAKIFDDVSVKLFHAARNHYKVANRYKFGLFTNPSGS